MLDQFTLGIKALCLLTLARNTAAKYGCKLSERCEIKKEVSFTLSFLFSYKKEREIHAAELGGANCPQVPSS